MVVINWICSLLLIIGGLNWGLVGAVDINLIDVIFGAGSGIARLIYCLVGLSAIFKIYNCSCMKGKSERS
jgi:uncharacterized protein